MSVAPRPPALTATGSGGLGWPAPPRPSGGRLGWPAKDGAVQAR